MLICFFIWFLISLISLFVAISFLSFFIEKDELLKFSIEYPFITVFIGVLVISNILMIISFFTPLRFYCIFLIFLLSFTHTFYLFWPRTKKSIEIINIPIENIIIIAASSVISFFYISLPYGEGCDLLGYHIQAPRYFYEYGTVKGLALVSAQLGHQSTWFTLPAPFEAILGIYSSLVIGSFSLFISFCQFLKSLLKAYQKPEEFFLASFFLLSILSLYIHVQPTSVEVVLNVSIGMALFCSLRYTSKSPSVQHEGNLQQTFNHFLWIAIILLLSTLALKITGIPVFLLAIYLFFHNASIRRHTDSYQKFIFLITFFAIPRLIATVLTSGCPLYPSDFLHLQVPWFVGKEFSQKLIEYIIIHARFGAETIPEGFEGYKWIYFWSQAYSGKYVFSLMCILLSTTVFFFLSAKENITEFYRIYFFHVFSLIIGVLYIFSTAPSIRFISSYIIGIIALYSFFISSKNREFAFLAVIISLTLPSVFLGSVKSAILEIMLLILLGYLSFYCKSKYTKPITVLIYLQKIISSVFYFMALSIYSHSEENFILLPNTSSLERSFEKVKINDVVFFHPTNSITRGYIPLPCYANRLGFEIPLEQIELIDKEKGIAGGFKRKNHSPE